MRAIEWGSGAEWFGAIATTAAVVIALFQRRWDERERITFRVNLSKEKLSIHLFNPTNHPVVIQHCTLELGRWRRSDFDDEGIDLLLGFIGMPMNLKAHEDTTFTVAAPYVDVSYLPRPIAQGAIAAISIQPTGLRSSDHRHWQADTSPSIEATRQRDG